MPLLLLISVSVITPQKSYVSDGEGKRFVEILDCENFLHGWVSRVVDITMGKPVSSIVSNDRLPSPINVCFILNDEPSNVRPIYHCFDAQSILLPRRQPAEIGNLFHADCRLSDSVAYVKLMEPPKSYLLQQPKQFTVDLQFAHTLSPPKHSSRRFHFLKVNQLLIASAVSPAIASKFYSPGQRGCRPTRARSHQAVVHSRQDQTRLVRQLFHP